MKRNKTLTALCTVSMLGRLTKEYPDYTSLSGALAQHIMDKAGEGANGPVRGVWWLLNGSQIDALALRLETPVVMGPDPALLVLRSDRVEFYPPGSYWLDVVEDAERLAHLHAPYRPDTTLMIHAPAGVCVSFVSRNHERFSSGFGLEIELNQDGLIDNRILYWPSGRLQLQRGHERRIENGAPVWDFRSGEVDLINAYC